MSELKLYNTFTKKEEIFTPLEKGKVKMYTCGPTVYGRPHIGNYSSFLMADLLRRWLEVSGYAVTHVKNITDVGHLVADQDEGEDKIEKQAKTEQVDPLEIAKKYTLQYLEDEKALNMVEPEQRPKATETIKEMLATIKILLKKRNAYETDDGVYFSVESFEAYGKLSGNTLENLDAGARVKVKEDKKHPADFALWKKCVGNNGHHLLRWSFDTGERVSTEGDDAEAGFPGWHIECSAMSTKFFGEQIDIHTGGEDNIFPHHECEVAQSECASGKQFVRLWLHKRRIDMGAEKMSKSLGNVLSISDITDMRYSPLDLRYYFLSVHYRTPLKFMKKGLDDARKARRKIMNWMKEVDEEKDDMSEEESVQYSNTSTPPFGLVNEFTNAMNSDLNTPAALAVVFTAISRFRNAPPASGQAIREYVVFAKIIRETFGCFDDQKKEDIPAEVSKLFTEREAARESKDFAASDSLRDRIKELGYEVRDTDEGQKVDKM